MGFAPKRVYVASALAEWRSAKSIAAEIRQMGFRVVSRWHDEVTSGEDAVDPKVRRIQLARNTRDVDLANLFVLYAATGVPRCALWELGFFMGRHRPHTIPAVVWIQGHDGAGSNIADAHDVVEIVQPHNWKQAKAFT